MFVVAVDDAELVVQRHVGELVREIVVVAVARGILVNETALFQFEASVVVRVRGQRTAAVDVVTDDAAEQYAFRDLSVDGTLGVVQQRLFQRHAVEIHVFLDVTAGGGGLSVIPWP